MRNQGAFQLRWRAMEQKIHSVSVRLRRTKQEYAFVSVPLDAELWEPHPDDPTKRRVNGERVFEVAKRMANDPETRWAPEGEAVIEIHPWQTPPPQS